MSLCTHAYLRVFPQWFLNGVWKRDSLPSEELFNIFTLDPLLPTFLLATLSLCILLVLAYLSLPCLGTILGILTKPLVSGPLHPRHYRSWSHCWLTLIKVLSGSRSYNRKGRVDTDVWVPSLNRISCWIMVHKPTWSRLETKMAQDSLERKEERSGWDDTICSLTSD